MNSQNITSSYTYISANETQFTSREITHFKQTPRNPRDPKDISNTRDLDTLDGLSLNAHSHSHDTFRLSGNWELSEPTPPTSGSPDGDSITLTLFDKEGNQDLQVTIRNFDYEEDTLYINNINPFNTGRQSGGRNITPEQTRRPNR